MKDCFFLSSMPFSQLFSPKNTTPRSPVPPKNNHNHNKTKSTESPLTDWPKARIQRPSKFFWVLFFKRLASTLFPPLLKTQYNLVPDRTCTTNINDRSSRRHLENTNAFFHPSFQTPAEPDLSKTLQTRTLVSPLHFPQFLRHFSTARQAPETVKSCQNRVIFQGRIHHHKHTSLTSSMAGTLTLTT